MVCVALSHVAANSKAGKSRVTRGGLRRERGYKLVHEEQSHRMLAFPTIEKPRQQHQEAKARDGRDG